MGFFKGTRALISNIAQIVLIVILMPFIAILLGAVFGTDAGGKGIADVLVSLAGKIPLCDVWLDIYYQHSGGLSAQDVMSSTVFVILKALPEAQKLYRQAKVQHGLGETLAH